MPDATVLIPIPEQRLARTALARLNTPSSSKGRLIYVVGPSGCGKSAVIHAARKHWEESRPAILIVTASEFGAQLAEASTQRQLPEFQERFRSVSVFVCEDVQSLSGRKESQQQLLAAIDDLLAQGDDVVISSTKTPGQLIDFSAKLVNRFRGGTLVVIKNPDSESRAELLRWMTRRLKVTFPRDVVALLAESLDVSARELMGVVQQLAQRKPVRRSVVEQFLQSNLPSSKIRPSDVCRAVAVEFGVTTAALKSSRRSAALVLPRQCAMWLCRKHCESSLPQLGKFFERQHSSVLHAIRRLDERLQGEPKLRQRLSKLEMNIRPARSIKPVPEPDNDGNR